MQVHGNHGDGHRVNHDDHRYGHRGNNGDGHHGNLGDGHLSDVYCCLELDSCGHFYMKARTRIIRKTACPEWNENFELELDGSRTLRVLCYKKVADSSGDVLLGRVAIEVLVGFLSYIFLGNDNRCCCCFLQCRHHRFCV